MAPIRFGIVEDDRASQAWLRAAVGSRPGWALAWVADSLRAAQKELTREAARVDVVLVDLGLPDGTGVEFIAQVARVWPLCLPMVVSVFGDERRVLASIHAGAKGYLLKGLPTPEFIVQVDELLAGGSPMSPGIARLILENLQKANLPKTTTVAADGMKALSAREREVIQLVARGYTYIEIAERFTLAPNTVKSHIKKIYDKLQVHSRTEAVFEARRYGLLD